MRQRSRTRLVMKWSGVAMCLLLLALGLVSRRWRVTWVHSKQVESEWHKLEHVPFLAVPSTEADEWPRVCAVVSMQCATITVVWEHDPNADSLRLAARPGWRVTRRRLPCYLMRPEPTGFLWSKTTDNWWKWIEWSDCTALRAYRSLTIRPWPSILAVAALTLIAWWRDRRFPRGHCQHCGYDLTGNVSGRCPECGCTVDGPLRR